MAPLFSSKGGGRTKDRPLTKEEAVALLIVWRDQNIPKYNLDFSPAIKRHITSGLENVYLNGLWGILMDQIRDSPYDPITVVANYYYEMDDILAMSDDDHFVTHRFASVMENAAHDIMSFLMEQERSLNQYERSKSAGKV